jgi:HlyD family secretion protein
MDREITIEEQKKRRNKQIVRFSLIAIAIMAVIIVLIKLSQQSVKESEISMSTVDRGTLEVSYTASGVVTAAAEEMVNSPINSRILEVYHKSGDNVDVGTPLMKLDLTEAQTDMSKAEDERDMKKCELEQLRLNNQTQLNDLKMKIKVSMMEVSRMDVELRNERYLDSLGSGTTDRVREAEMNLKKGKLQLDQLRQEYNNERLVKAADVRAKILEYNILVKNVENISHTLTDAQLRSPRKAILTFIDNRIGAQVAQGSKVAVVSDLSHFKVDCEIADTYSNKVIPGAKAIVKIGTKTLEGMISNVIPLSQNGVIDFSVQMKKDDDAALRSGLKVDVYVLSTVKENVLRLGNGPYYVNNAGEYSLFVKEGNSLVRRNVRLGESNYDYVEVISGLKEGDRVAIGDMGTFKGRNKIKIK